MAKMSIVLILTLLLGIISCSSAELQIGFYDKYCPKAEEIIYNYVKQHISIVPSIAPAVLRLHFHDCFVRGCDASVLVNSTKNHKAEKSAQPNLTLRGFSFIDKVKNLVEEECPGVVSCADVLALVARDAVATLGGPYWNVPTGRRDGLTSEASEALKNLPPPSSNFTSLQSLFASKGLNLKDLVWLSGAHTIGISHCPSFDNRLYNFTGKGDEDPSLDPYYAANLKKYKCKSLQDKTTIVEMDPGSYKTFDLGYYKHLLQRRGLFESDAALLTNVDTKSTVVEIVHSPVEVFFKEFGLSMEKMGRIGVITGSDGEIRKHCAVING